MTIYHLKRSEKAIIDPNQIELLLQQGRFVTLALCRDNEPYLVTLNYGYDQRARVLYFHCAHQGHKIDIVRSNADVCASLINDMGYQTDECDHHFQSLIIRGRLQIVADILEKKHGIEVMISHLEAEPDKVRATMLKKESTYRTFTILKLVIDDITGKQNL